MQTMHESGLHQHLRVGMLGSPGMAARMFGALSGAGINIEVISTSEISLSCLIRAERAKDAVNAIHAAFFRESR